MDDARAYRRHRMLSGRFAAATPVAISALAIVGAAALAACDARALKAAQQTSPDSVNAVRALGAVRDMSPLACDLVVRSLGSGWWGQHSRQPDSQGEFLDLERWMTGPSSDPAGVRVLAGSLADPDGCVRRVGARLLGRNRHPSASDVLLQALGSADPETRTAAAIGLGVSGQREAVTRLIDVLADQAPSVRAAAAWALGQVDDPEANQHLIRLLERDLDPGVRQAAAWALGEIK